ncbi:VC0807 family protein [Microbacterium sp.]|uniref:VC0807 family protein n=1 Tax=Microbacterium sp. TaxID=51671 RepID=UPI003342A9B4
MHREKERRAPRPPWLLRLVGGLLLDVGLWLGAYLSFLVSILLSVLTGDPHVLLWKGVVMVGLWGLVTVGTLRFGKPLLFNITQRLVAPGRDGYREWLSLWESSTPFRWLFRRLTLVWGACFLVLAAMQSVVIILLPTEVAAPLQSTVSPLVNIALVGWTVWYSQKAERSLDRPLKDDEARAAAEGAQPAG